jgi:hypothetical protein
MVFDVGLPLFMGSYAAHIEATPIDDLADHLGESRMPIPCVFVLTYSVAR